MELVPFALFATLPVPATIANFSSPLASATPRLARSARHSPGQRTRFPVPRSRERLAL